MSVRETLYIGGTPSEEKCTGVSSEHDYLPQMRAESQAYIHLLRRTLGEEPQGAYLRIARENHDFGPYLEVVCDYDPTSEEAVKYALKCESEGPLYWDDAATEEIKAKGFEVK